MTPLGFVAYSVVDNIVALPWIRTVGVTATDAVADADIGTAPRRKKGIGGMYYVA